MMNRRERSERFRRAGAIADGAVKVLLGGAYIAGVGWLGPLLDVPTWLMLLSGVVLLAAGCVEVGLVDRRSPRLYLRLMIAFDSCWVLASVVGLLLARSVGGVGGVVWIGYQVVAALIFATVLLNSRSSARAATPAPAR